MWRSVLNISKYQNKNIPFCFISRHIPTRHYHKKVIDHYEQPCNVGSMDKQDRNVGTGLVGAPACGDVMKLQILVRNGVIKDAKFKVQAAIQGEQIRVSSKSKDDLQAVIAHLKGGSPVDIPLQFTNFR